MADGGRGSYEEEEVPMTAEEESAFASAQAATGMAMLHKPHSAFRVMATELGGNMGSDPSSQRGMADPSAHDSAARSKERRQRCGVDVRWSRPNVPLGERHHLAEQQR